jgi:hypothetical protein
MPHTRPVQPLQDICPYLRTEGSGRIICPQEILGWGVLGSPVKGAWKGVSRKYAKRAVFEPTDLSDAKMFAGWHHACGKA